MRIPAMTISRRNQVALVAGVVLLLAAAAVYAWDDEDYWPLSCNVGKAHYHVGYGAFQTRWWFYVGYYGYSAIDDFCDQGGGCNYIEQQGTPGTMQGFEVLGAGDVYITNAYCVS